MRGAPGATSTEFVYALGQKLALMNGQTQGKACVALPGGTQVKYTGTTISTYRLPDWLGSLRVGSNPNRPIPGACLLHRTASASGLARSPSRSGR
jgi:hypothetical protein